MSRSRSGSSRFYGQPGAFGALPLKVMRTFTVQVPLAGHPDQSCSSLQPLQWNL
jgi:hypothetical protein